MDDNKELKLLLKCQKKSGVVHWGVPVGLGGQGVCERSIEVIVLLQKKGWGPQGVRMGGRGGLVWGEVRVDVFEELKLL